MKRTLLLSLLCMILAMPAMAQPGYRYGYNPRVQTVGRHGNEYVAWHRYYLGVRVGMNASHVSSDSPSRWHPTHLPCSLVSRDRPLL